MVTGSDPSLVNIIISDDNDGKNLIRTDFVYTEFIGHNLKVSHLTMYVTVDL